MNPVLRISFTFLLLLSVSGALRVTATEPADSTVTPVSSITSTTVLQQDSSLYAPDTVASKTEKVSNTYWIRQLIDNGFRIHDPSVRYPRFPRFCLNVYNWGDRTFTSYPSL